MEFKVENVDIDKWTVTVSIKNKNPINKLKVKSNLKKLMPNIAGVTFDESKMEFTARLSPTKPDKLYQLDKEDLKELNINLLEIYNTARKDKKENNEYGAPNFIKDLEMPVKRALMNKLRLDNGCTCWYFWTPGK